MTRHNLCTTTAAAAATTTTAAAATATTTVAAAAAATNTDKQKVPRLGDPVPNKLRRLWTHAVNDLCAVDDACVTGKFSILHIPWWL